MNSQEVVAGLRAHHGQVIQQAAGAPADLEAEIERALPELDSLSRSLAAQCLIRHDGARAGEILLRFAEDKDLAVATAAARGLSRLKHRPTGADALKTLRQAASDQVRQPLYLLLGHLSDAALLPALREALRTETNDRAHLAGLAAVIKLGGVEERAEMKRRIETAPADRVTDMCDLLEYVADRRLAPALLPWLTQEQEILRLGSDRTNRQARVCDLAVWTAHRLGVSFVITPDHLDRYTSEVIARAARAMHSQLE